MGPRAGARLDGNTTDGAESFTIKYLSSNDDGFVTMTVSAFGQSKTFQDVKQVHGNGGLDDDTLTVQGAFPIPIVFDGGVGTDHVVYDEQQSSSTITLHNQILTADGTALNLTLTEVADLTIQSTLPNSDDTIQVNDDDTQAIVPHIIIDGGDGQDVIN